jgi:3-hydroxyacyl-CoA dehydrogenase
MSRKIEKAAVLGAGIMGSGIAAHLANCGVRTYLLDIVPPELGEEDKKKGITRETPEFRNRFATSGLEKAVKNRKPIPAFYHDSFAGLVTCGNLEDNLDWLKECDWVVEVVVENLGIKQKLFERVEKHAGPETIVSSNTSGISIASMLEGRSAGFKKRFLVTHFFNPVRFMRLLELVPGKDTDPEILSFMARFGTDVLGKGVVFGKDTTNFVGNRIGIYGLIRTAREVIDRGYTLEEGDAIVGEPMGRPKSAAFRTVDMVGLDTVVHILDNCYETLTEDEEREIFKTPAFIADMIKAKRFGDKTKGGFYKKSKGDGGKSDVLALDPKTGEYREKQKVRFDSTGAVRGIDDPAARLKKFLSYDDRAATFGWNVLRDTLVYSGNRIPEIADDVVQIDNAMKWGYNWALGPFESWDAIGFKEGCERIRKDGKKLPAIAEALLAAGGEGFYKTEGGKRYFFDLATKKYKPVVEDALTLRLPLLKQQDKVLAHNDSATLYDMGDGVLCCEFHTKMNSIDEDVIKQINHGLDLCDRDDRWIGLVLGNHGEAFCAGANVFALLMAAQNNLWDQVEGVVKAFQDVNQRLKYSAKPTVAAPFAMALGGGAELSMGCNRICAHADLFMGLVEVGVGLIPGGGGHKEQLIRHLEGIPEGAQSVNLIPFLQAAFQNIGTAKVSMSADEARALCYLRRTDAVVTNKEHLLGRAKRMVQGMAVEGFVPPRERRLRLPGENVYATFLMVLDSMCKQHQITEHEQVMAGKIAWVLCGGKTSTNVEVSEQYLLDLEREAFCFLLGTPKTQERIQHFLTRGKPLRN